MWPSVRKELQNMAGLEPLLFTLEHLDARHAPGGAAHSEPWLVGKRIACTSGAGPLLSTTRVSEGSCRRCIRFSVLSGSEHDIALIGGANLQGQAAQTRAGSKVHSPGTRSKLRFRRACTHMFVEQPCGCCKLACLVVDFLVTVRIQRSDLPGE